MNLRDSASNNARFAHQTICDKRNLNPVACELLFRGCNGRTIDDFLNDPRLFVSQLDDLVKGKAIAIKSLQATHNYKMFFVNFTPDQIASPDFIYALRWFDENRIHASSVVIEVTELIHHHDNAKVFLENIAFLRRKGHLIAIDDFGSGYSNFDRILLLQPHIVKIDQSLLVLSSRSKEQTHSLRTLISFIHKVGAKCVVEGVEDDRLLDVAHKSGTDYLQGYHLSSPTLVEVPPKRKPLELAYNNRSFRNIGYDTSFLAI